MGYGRIFFLIFILFHIVEMKITMKKILCLYLPCAFSSFYFRSTEATHKNSVFCIFFWIGMYWFAACLSLDFSSGIFLFSSIYQILQYHLRQYSKCYRFVPWGYPQRRLRETQIKVFFLVVGPLRGRGG